MARIETTVDLADMDGDYGSVDGLGVTCKRCGHSVEVFGTSDASARAAGLMLSRECPRGEKNWYIVEEI